METWGFCAELNESRARYLERIYVNAKETWTGKGAVKSRPPDRKRPCRAGAAQLNAVDLAQPLGNAVVLLFFLCVAAAGPKVIHVDVFGVSAATGEDVTERIMP